MIDYMQAHSGVKQSRFGYDAVEDKGKRKAPTGVLRNEDTELMPNQRRKLVSGARDINRNFAIAAWMIRKHLDYVSTFSLQVKSENAALAETIEGKMAQWSRPGNCEITARHSLRRFVRLAEARRTIDNDCGILRLKSGQIQAIEGDRIRTPEGGWPATVKMIVPVAQARHGVITDPYGKPLQYSVCRRASGSDLLPVGGGFQFERFVLANHMYLHSYWDRFDQTRGVSPIAAAINSLRDVYEGFDYALAKMKVAQLFGMVFTTNAEEGVGNHSATDDSTEDAPKYQVDFGRGPVKLELEPGEDAKFLTVDSPGIATQDFLELMIAVSLKALDIPFSFYNESFTNYSGSRQAWIQYDQSAEEKRQDVRALLDWITNWKLLLWSLDGELPGADLTKVSLNWIPRGVPWIDPLKEVQADQAAVDGVFTSRQRVCKEHGYDFFEIVDEQAEEMAYAKSKGVNLGVLNPVHIGTPQDTQNQNQNGGQDAEAA